MPERPDHHRSIVRRLVRVGSRLVIGVTVTGVAVAGAMAVGSWRWNARDEAQAKMVTTGPYEASLESLGSRELPDWFQDAKFGIMLHWGPYSVPGFAPTGKTFTQLLAEDYDHALTRSPYAEDYANQIKDPESPAAAYHRAHYGDAPYSHLVQEFEEQTRAWNPDAWAEQFAAAGASYVVLTAKYADGYTLWPSAVRNPHAPDFRSDRDLVGELATAVRARGMKFGLYYSGGVDWTFQREVVQTLGDYIYLPYGDDYRDYAEAQVRELISRYEPDILWNDIGWPTGQQRLNALFADYYNTVPDGVVNDRWQTGSFTKDMMGSKPLRWAFDQFMEQVADSPEVTGQIAAPDDVPHSDFRTPEYTGHDTIQDKFWQQDRGIGGSFGYNAQETDSDYATPEALITELVEAAANNGAFLLNAGPKGGNGHIVPMQGNRLAAIGEWLTINREAIDSTRPWRRSTAETTDGLRVRFTRKGDDLYVVVLGNPTGPVTVKDVELRGPTELLGSEGKAAAEPHNGGTVLNAAFSGGFAPVFRIAGAAG